MDPQTVMVTSISGADDVELFDAEVLEVLLDVFPSLVVGKFEEESCCSPSTPSLTGGASPRSPALFPQSISPKQVSDAPQVRRQTLKQIAKRPATTISKCQLFVSQLAKQQQQQQSRRRTKPPKRRTPVSKDRQQCYDKRSAEKKKAITENVVYRYLFLSAVYAELLKQVAANHASTPEWVKTYDKIKRCAVENAEQITQVAKHMKFDNDQRSIGEKVVQNLQKLLARLASEYEKPSSVTGQSL